MGQHKLHFKMYKDGKKWVFAGIATISVGIGLTSMDRIAHADTIASEESTLINNSISDPSNASGVASEAASSASNESAAND